MSLLYRAIWNGKTSAGDNFLDLVKSEVSSWINHSEHSPLDEKSESFTLPNGSNRKYTYRDLENCGFEAEVFDTSAEGTKWTTLIRAYRSENSISLLVENGMESEDLSLRVKVGRPRIVDSLLRLFEKPHLDGSVILTEPIQIPANGIDILVDLLEDPSRTLPIIVCTQPNREDNDRWKYQAKRISNRVEGVATVVTLDSQAVKEFRSRLGNLSAWGGQIRIYTTGVVTADADAWKHRYYTRSQIEEYSGRVVDKIVYSVTQLSTRRRVPAVFDVFNSYEVGTPQESIEETLAERDLELEIAREEQGDLELELAQATGHLSRIKDELLRRGMGDIIWGTQQESENSVPDEVFDTSEAIAAAKEFLSEWIVIPESAAQDLDAIDTTNTAFTWGNTAWRGLRALAAYAKDCSSHWEKGGFWEWCDSGQPLAWPATTKKLSMSESETVQNSDKLSKKRVFDVDKRVDNSGKIKMLAHLKIAEGGGDLAPRIYFYDDTRGKTQKVHIGLVGPHYLVPNKSTN